MHREAFLHRPEVKSQSVFDMRPLCEELLQLYTGRTERTETPFPLDMLKLPLRAPTSRADGSLFVGGDDVDHAFMKPAVIVVARDASPATNGHYPLYGVSLRFADGSPVLIHGINHGDDVPTVPVTEIDVILATDPSDRDIEVVYVHNGQIVTPQVQAREGIASDFVEGLTFGLASKIDKAKDLPSRVEPERSPTARAVTVSQDALVEAGTR